MSNEEPLYVVDATFWFDNYQDATVVLRKLSDIIDSGAKGHYHIDEV